MHQPASIAEDNEAGWAQVARHWSLADGVTYLNHGSFGPAPACVLAEHARWRDECQRQPMDFFVRRLDGLLRRTRERLGAWIGASPDSLALVENSTVAMNVVAASVRLKPGDEVLANDHEYGAVLRIWQRACDAAGARLVVARVGVPIDSPDQIVRAIFSAAGERTRLLVVSHITSPTAIIFPVEAICSEARRRGIATCIDGPHAPVIVDLALDALDCDYYTASCHKWLSAPFGSGFLYAAPRVQADVRPACMSWGRPPAGEAASWRDEFNWVGTRDVAAVLSIPAAIDWIESLPLAAFRRRAHWLTRRVRERIERLTGLAALVPDQPPWYGSMIALPLPPGPAEPLQRALWEEHRIEVPIVDWEGKRLARVSCHAYTQASHVDLLVDALAGLLR